MLRVSYIPSFSPWTIIFLPIISLLLSFSSKSQSLQISFQVITQIQYFNMLPSTHTTTLFLSTLLLSSFSNLALASPIYETSTSISSNTTASYTPSLSILAPVPTSTIASYPSNSNTTISTSTSTTFMTSPTGTSISNSNGTSGGNSTSPSATGRPLSPSATLISTSGSSGFRDFGLSSVALGVVVMVVVAGL